VERKDAKQLQDPLEGWDRSAARTTGCSYRMNSNSDATGGADTLAEGFYWHKFQVNFGSLG
jgi:hypothetical protein